MQINRENLDKLLKLSDNRLKAVINRLAEQSGIDPAEFDMDPNSIGSIRNALSSVSDEDIRRIALQYEASLGRGKR